MMSTTELIQLICPDEVSTYLALMHKEGLTPYKWRLSSTGAKGRGRIFMLRGKSKEHGEAVIMDFPTIDEIVRTGWVGPHLVMSIVKESVLNLKNS